MCRIPGVGDQTGTDAYILTKYQDISLVLRDPDRFPLLSDEGDPSTRLEREIISSQGFADAVGARETLRPNREIQKLHRQQLTDPWVGPTGALRHKTMVTRIANELIDSWRNDGSVEFVRDFAAALPQTVITKIIGFPLKDMRRLRKWEEAQVQRFVFGKTHRNLMPEEEERANAQALGEFHAYIQQQIDIKRTQRCDDMISFLIDVHFGLIKAD